MKFLIIEDEQDLRGIIAGFLKGRGYRCETAASFSEAYEKVIDHIYDIVLLDIGLPGGSGLDLIGEIRESAPECGIIIISARNSLDDKTSGLDLGADDYLTKPFQLPELHSRIRALLRRRQFRGSSELHFQEITLNTDSRSVRVNSCELAFTRKEYDLLLFFITNADRILTKDAIAEHLWEDSVEFADNFDFIYTHMNNIRKKIRSAGGKDYIRSVYGVGYRFTDR